MVKRREVEYHRRLPGSRQADSSGRLLALIVSRHAARARGPRRSPAPRRPASRCASARRLPSWACPTTAGKWGNKLPTARRDFCGDLGPDRVCVAPGRTQTAAGGAREEIYVGVDRRAASRRLCLRRPVQDNSLLFFPPFPSISDLSGTVRAVDLARAIYFPGKPAIACVDWLTAASSLDRLVYEDVRTVTEDFR